MQYQTTTSMKKSITTRGSHRDGNFLVSRRALCALAAAALLLPASRSHANLIDLTTPYPTSGSFAAGTSAGGSGAIYSTIDNIPTGTGVFSPFLTYQANGTEDGFNTSQGGSGQGYMDTKRVAQWNHDLHLGDLVPTTLGGKTYYAFELDANETGGGNDNRRLSVDDIRIYTSATDTANTVGDNSSLVNSLGTLRYSQNATLGVTANWVLIDASRHEGGHTSGSGSSDMVVLVPTTLFAGALPTDFLYFYTTNGVHEGAIAGSQSNSGYEEWAANVSPAAVPEGGSTLLLLGSSLLVLGLFAYRRKSLKTA
jgi:hypothetical protein